MRERLCSEQVLPDLAEGCLAKMALRALEARGGAVNKRVVVYNVKMYSR